MLSAGERPQPPVTPAVASKLPHIMPDMEPNTGSSTPAMLSKPTDPSTVQHIWVVTGPAGCGKSTVGQGIRKELGISFLEGDDVRPSFAQPYTPKPPKKLTQIFPNSTTTNPTKRRWATASPSPTKTVGTG